LVLFVLSQRIEMPGSLKHFLAALTDADPSGNISGLLGALAILGRLAFWSFRHGGSIGQMNGLGRI